MKVCFWQEQETACLEKTGEQLQPACLGIHTPAYRACFGAVYRTMVLELIPKFRGKLIMARHCMLEILFFTCSNFVEIFCKVMKYTS